MGGRALPAASPACAAGIPACAFAARKEWSEMFPRGWPHRAVSPQGLRPELDLGGSAPSWVFERVDSLPGWSLSGPGPWLQVGPN